MKIQTKTHVLGACGTFMAGVAQLARSLSHQVTAVDENVYPPMSTLLEQNNIKLISGYQNYCDIQKSGQSEQADVVVIGNALSRGNPAVEEILNQKLPYISGPQWLYENILSKTTVLAVSGTHGKTTTSSMLAWILDYAGYEPGFLIGGIPNNFNCSARLGAGNYFVIEADEYDSAFFDKRSKFVHYHSDILIINNIEFDHADIFNNLDEIKKQFHYAVRTVPANGAVVYNAADNNILNVLDMGLWSHQESFNLNNKTKNNWSAELVSADGSRFKILYKNNMKGEINWKMYGMYNIENGLAAIAAANKVGINVDVAIEALNKFSGIKRRQELIAQIGSVNIFEDFAHHPTAIKATLEGFRNKQQNGRLIVLLELASNTMRSGCHNKELIAELVKVDAAYVYSNQKDHSDISKAILENRSRVQVCTQLEKLLDAVVSSAQPQDTIVIMSNGAFGNVYKKLPALLEQIKLERGL